MVMAEDIGIQWRKETFANRNTKGNINECCTVSLLAGYDKTGKSFQARSWTNASTCTEWESKNKKCQIWNGKVSRRSIGGLKRTHTLADKSKLMPVLWIVTSSPKKEARSTRHHEFFCPCSRWVPFSANVVNEYTRVRPGTLPTQFDTHAGNKMFYFALFNSSTPPPPVKIVPP